MKVLVLGATGYIGAALTERLLERGHHVVALAREASASRLPAGVEVRIGDLQQPETLSAAVTDDIDGVVHAATLAGGADADVRAVETLLSRLRGTDRFFVYTSGVWALGPTGTEPADEDAPTRPVELVSLRPTLEHHATSSAAERVRAVVIRPGIVHGRGGGIPALLVDWASTHGGGRYVGAEGVRWPMVHVDDLADLYVAAIEGAEPGTVLHGVTEQAVPVRELAAAAAVAAGVSGPVASWPLADARAALGTAFADALALDQSVSGDRARALLGWQPSRAGAVQDLGTGSYVATAAA